jgi:hypothetical protein
LGNGVEVLGTGAIRCSGLGNEISAGLSRTWGFSRSRRRERPECMYMKSLYSAFSVCQSVSPSLSRESSPVHPIDGFVWQYNVEPARATSEALDASQSASQPTEPPGPQFPVDKKRYPRVRSASPGYQQADREVDGAPKCCRRQAVDTRVTRIPGTRLRWESVHEKHKAIFPPSRTAYAKGGMIYTTTCITSGSGSLLMQTPYLPIYCI